MADFLPPLVGRLVGDISGFAAKMGEATAIAKAETGASTAAFNGLATVGKAAFLGLGAAAVIGGGAAVKMAGDFESATNRLVTSAGEARGNIDLVRKGMLDMAGQVGYSAMDLSKAMYIVESAGQHGANGLTVLRAAAEGAKAENADLAKVADAVTSALQDYHLPATAAAQVTTTLVAAVSQGKTTFEELTGSLHSVLPVASAAHISLADISAAVASMTVHGMSADQATQNLAHAIEHLQKTTAPQQKELALLGINTRQLSDDLGTKGLTGTLMEVSNAIQQHMGPDGHVILQMQQALAGLPPSVQKLGASVVNGTTSLGDFTKAAKGLNVEQAGLAHQFATLMTSTHGIGSAQKSGAEIAQTYAQALAAATGDATTLQVALMLTGENAAYTTGAVKTVAGATVEAGNHVKGWADIQGTFNQKVDRMREGLGAVAITVGTQLIPYVEKAMDVTAGLAEWLSKNQQVSVPLAVAIGGVLLVAIAAYTVSMAAAAIATIAATWPLLLIIAAVALVAAGIALLVMHWSQITAFLGGAWKTASTAAGHAFSALGSAVHGFVNGALSAVGGFFSGLGSRVQAGIAAVGGFFSELGARVHGTLTAAWNLAGSIVRAGVAFITGIVSAFVRGVVGFFEWLYNHNYYFQALVDFVRNAFVRVRNEAVMIWTAIGNWLGSTWAAISGTARSIWSAVTDWIGARWAYMSGLATLYWTAITAFIGQKLTDSWAAVTSVWNRITGWLGGVWNQIAGAAGYWWGVVSSAIGGKVREAWNTITGVFGGLGGWFADRSRDAWNWGYNLIQSIGRGIGAAAGFIGNAVRQIGGVIADWLGFHSPTKLGPGAEADMWAPNFIRMYAGGLRAGAGSVRAAAFELAAAVAPPIGGVGTLPGAGGLASSASGGAAGDNRTLELHTHVYLGSEQIAHLVDRRADARLSRLLTST